MRHAREQGNASLEFIAVSVLLMAPIAYAVIALAQLESAVYGVNGAAQMAARAYANSNSDATGRYAAARSAAIAGRNHSLIITSDQVTLSCDMANCLTPGANVRIRVDTTARLTAAPFLRNVPLHATQTVVIDPFRQSPA